MMATDTKGFVTDMFKQATESFNHTMRTGIEFQEETAKFWADTFGKGFDQFRTQFDKVSKEVVPSAQKNLQQFHNMFDDQAKMSLDMLRRTFDTGQEWNVQKMFDQTSDAWQKSFDMMRSNADMMTKANVEMFENFCEMAKKSVATNGHKNAAKAASNK